MDMELINSQIAYEKARHNMEVCHIDCLKIEEELAHLKHLSALEKEKDKLLEYYSVRNFTTYKQKKCLYYS